MCFKAGWQCVHHSALPFAAFLWVQGTVTGTVSYLGSCVVLALVAVCQNCLDLIVSNRRYGYCSAASKSAVLLTMTAGQALTLIHTAQTGYRCKRSEAAYCRAYTPTEQQLVL
ncbi:TPA: hypothetical protein ACH3X3_006563 [Trebouxia sp. C0006]